MLNDLIESKRTTDRSPGGAAASVVVHAVIIVLVVAVTAQASGHPGDAPSTTDLVFIPSTPPAPPAPPASPAPPRAPAPGPEPAPVMREGIVVVAPPTIPTTLPPIGLPQPTIRDDYMGPTVALSPPNGGAGGAPTAPGGAYVAWQVEKQTMPLSNNPKPVYPGMLESARVDGRVLARFVVDTTGRADMSTFSVIETTNELFATAVERVLPAWRFRPAEAGGHKVKQLVQMPFAFTVP